MAKKRLYLESLGCSKALVDSESALAFILAGDFILTESAQAADVLLLNTCSFIESAREQSVERIIELGRIKAATGAKLAVMGCLPQRYAAELKSEMPEIDLLAGVGQQAALADALHALFERPDAHPDGRLTPGQPQISFAGYLDRPLLTPPHLAYVKVGEGCSRSCSFCAIPAIRGRFMSRPPGEIEAEIRGLADRGVREINLISQDTAFYGRDRQGPAFLPLLERLSAIESLRWIRIFYLHPVLVSLPELLELFSLPRVVPYLDMPVQHASDAMLRRMRRGHDRRHLERLFSELRRERPDLTLRTTVLVGHPGETDADFDSLLDFLDMSPFDKLGVFGYSREVGTHSADQGEEVPAELIADRMEQVQVTQMALSEERNRAQIGRRLAGFVEALAGVGDGLPPERSLDPLASAPFPDARVAVRTERDAYEVDGHLFLAQDRGLSLGDWVEVEVTGADVFDLSGRLVSAPTLP